MSDLTDRGLFEFKRDDARVFIRALKHWQRLNAACRVGDFSGITIFES